MGEDPRRRLGALGEHLARRHLEARGLTVLDRNFRTRHGELDLVAQDERYLVFCEVKTRVLRAASDRVGPFASIGRDKRRRVRRMAAEWLSENASHAGAPPELRFDAIGVSFDAHGRLLELAHVEDAF